MYVVLENRCLPILPEEALNNTRLTGLSGAQAAAVFVLSDRKEESVLLTF